MRIAFVGAVESSARALRTMLSVGHSPAVVVTLTPERSARHADFVDIRDMGAEVLPTDDVNAPDILARLKAHDITHLFVIGWSQICRPQLLGTPTVGTIGYHPGALPENRGRAVIPWTILQGCTRTAGTLFWIDEGMDSGDIINQEHFDVAPDETARTLYDKHLDVLESMLRRSLPALADGNAPRRAQDHRLATWCARRRPEDAYVDWQAAANDVWTLIRAAGAPYPGAYTTAGDRTIVLETASLIGPAPYWGVPGQVQAADDDGVLVRCGDDGHVRIESVRVDAGPAVPAGEVLRLHERLGAHPPPHPGATR